MTTCSVWHHVLTGTPPNMPVLNRTLPSATMKQAPLLWYHSRSISKPRNQFKYMKGVTNPVASANQHQGDCNSRQKKPSHHCAMWSDTYILISSIAPSPCKFYFDFVHSYIYYLLPLPVGCMLLSIVAALIIQNSCFTGATSSTHEKTHAFCNLPRKFGAARYSTPPRKWSSTKVSWQLFDT